MLIVRKSEISEPVGVKSKRTKTVLDFSLPHDTLQTSTTKHGDVMKHQIGDLVWLHGKGWCTHPLLVVGIIGDYKHIKVMSTQDTDWIMTFVPEMLFTQPKETK